jgi:acetyltransferase-like isoleucine patch superfamily enzyme
VAEQSLTSPARGWREKFGDYVVPLFGLMHFKYRLANLICGLLPNFTSGVVRGRLYRRAGFQIDAGSFIMGNLDLISGLDGFYEKLILGPNVVIGDHVTNNRDAEVRLGQNVALGPRVVIYTGSHQIGPGSKRRVGGVLAKPVTIEDGCWIGLAAIILPGVTVGHGSIVAAGAVVGEDVPPDSYVEGNPGKVVRKLPWGNR